MNTVTLKRAGETSGPIILAAGATSLLMALLSASHSSPAAAGPAPTVTATVTAPAPTAGRTAVAAHPRPSGRSAVSVVSVSDHRSALPHNGSGDLSHRQARPPSAPKPSPTPSAAAAPCSGGVLAVRLLRSACVSIGGDR